jgi:hypothetical protein
MPKGEKTKRCGSTDLASKSFLWVGNRNDTATWLLPVYDPTSTKKTQTLIQSSVYRFDEVKARIPMEEHSRLRTQLAGAAQSFGIQETATTIQVTDDEMALLLEDRHASGLFADIDEDYD